MKMYSRKIILGLPLYLLYLFRGNGYPGLGGEEPPPIMHFLTDSLFLANLEKNTIVF